MQRHWTSIVLYISRFVHIFHCTFHMFIYLYCITMHVVCDCVHFKYINVCQNLHLLYIDSRIKFNV